MSEKKWENNTFEVTPIGTIHRERDYVEIKITEPYRPALKQLDHFSHVMVFWWANLFDNDEARVMLRTTPPYAPEHECGVFATRSPYRPNPIMMTTCTLLSMDDEEGIVKIAEIDAFDGTAVVDLKAYFPVCDRVKEASIPAWLSDWPDWMPEEGIGLEDYEKEQQAFPERMNV
jgi:tRNA-Thr(GGU) m(6)t(6)A37 methyltransferase TsaA